MKISKKTYLENKGLICPNLDCFSENVTSHGSVDVDGTHGWLDSECLDCGLNWVDEYILTNVGNFTNKQGEYVTAIDGDV